MNDDDDDDDTPLLELADCTLGYARRAVVCVDRLAVHPARCLGVFGPNGSGKTTLLRAIAGLLKPMTGEIRRVPRLRVGYLPQLRTIDPTWPMSGLDAASLAASSRSLPGWVGRGRRRAIRRRMEQLAVRDLAHRPFRTLSGGQQQRILLAGVLAIDPQLLLLDEPTDGLDLRSRDLLVETLRQEKQAGLGIVLITHDPEELAMLADDVVHLHVPDAPGEPSHLDLRTPARANAATRIATSELNPRN